MTKKQEQLLGLLRELDEICRKEGLRYVMAGGSLIGVLRNEGFIPWDDDVDIYMPRDDWNRLVALSKDLLPPNRTLECVDVDREYTNTFPRYGSTDTCSIHKHQIIGRDPAGEIIDVLTLDPIPDSDRKYRKYRNNMMIYSELVNLNSVFMDRWEISPLIYRWNRLLYKVLGRDRCLRRLERKMFSYSEEKSSRFAMRWGGCPFLFDKKMLFPVKDAMFEGMKVMVPAHMSDYLIWHYGDEWCYIPRHAERESHDTISPAGMDYKEFREIYLPQLDEKKIKRDSIRRKQYYISSASKSHRILSERQRLLGIAVVMDLRARVTESFPEGQSLWEAVQQRQYERLNYVFEEYFRVQLSAEFIGREDFSNIYRFYHPTVLELDEEERKAAVYTLFYTERISKADRLMKIWKSQREKGWNAKFQRTVDFGAGLIRRGSRSRICFEDIMLQDIALFRMAADYTEQGKPESAKAIIDGLLERYPENPSFMKLKLYLLFEPQLFESHKEEARNYLAFCLEGDSKDGYYLKYLGDLLWSEERRREALTAYAYARSNTTNGMVWLAIEKKVKPLLAQDMGIFRQMLEEESAPVPEDLAPDASMLSKGGKTAKDQKTSMKIGELEVLFDPEDLEETAKASLKDAASLIWLWTKLLPDSPLVKAYDSLGKAYRAKTSGQLETLAKSMEKRLRGGNLIINPVSDSFSEEVLGIYTDAFGCIYERLGYPYLLARIKAELILADKEAALDRLENQLSRLTREDLAPAREKILGDLFLRRGLTKDAFKHYLTAYRQADFPYLKRELTTILLTDLRSGSEKLKKIPPKMDKKAFLDGWLDKYGSLEQIQELVADLGKTREDTP